MVAAEIMILFMLVGLLVLCGTICLLVLILRGGGSKKRNHLEADETRLIQELHRDLNRLEQRLESIETILFENERLRERTK